MQTTDWIKQFQNVNLNEGLPNGLNEEYFVETIAQLTKSQIIMIICSENTLINRMILHTNDNRFFISSAIRRR